MVDYNLKRIQEYIKEDLKRLENSNLKQANKEKYEYFKNKYYALNKKVLECQTSLNAKNIITLNPQTAYSFLNEYARLSVEYEIYMDFYGGSKIINEYQINSICNNLNKILNKLTKENYQEIELELANTLKLYENIIASSLNSFRVSNLITKIKYQITKYRLDIENTYKSENKTDYLPLVIEDIENIINNPNTSSYIKEELEKYYIDTTLLLNNFYYVLKLIINSSRNLSLSQLKAILNDLIYNEQDLIKVSPNIFEKDISKLDYLKAKYTEKYAIEAIFNKDNSEEYVAEYIALILTSNEFSYADIVASFVKHNFKNYMYLAKLYLSSSKPNLSTILTLTELLKNAGLDFSYELACAIISYKENIPLKDLIEYIITTDNIYLLNWLISNNLVDYYSQDFYLFIKNNHPEKMTAIKNPTFKLTIILSNYLKEPKSETFQELTKELSKLPLKTQINWIINNKLESQFLDIITLYIKCDESLTLDFILKLNLSLESKKTLLDIYLTKEEINISNIISIKDSNLKNNALTKMLKNKTFEELQTIITNNCKNVNSVLTIINNIEDLTLKNEIISWLYSEIKKENNSFIKKLIGENLENNLDKLNIFEIYYLTIPHNCSLKFEDIKKLFELYPHCKIDYEGLIINCINKNIELYCFLYSKNPQEFISLLKDEKIALTSDIAFSMVNKYPELITYLIKYFNYDSIPLLNKETLDIYCTNYEINLNKNNISIMDKIEYTLKHNNKDEQFYLFTYIMHKGLINEELLINFLKISHNKVFSLQAIKNTLNPYLRPSLIKILSQKVLLKNKDTLIAILSDYELEELEKDPNASLKLEKYYSNLIDILNSIANDDIKIKIIQALIKLNDESLNAYLKSKFYYHPSYSRIIEKTIEEQKINSKLKRSLKK